jgi:SAM-dependent methyltransferase
MTPTVPPRRPPEAVFGADWLERREPFDRASRDAAARALRPAPRLAAWRAARDQAGSPAGKAQAAHAAAPGPAARPPGPGPLDRPWRVIDLACGTGANLRWLAPRLGGSQQWLVVDHDPALLARWPRSPGLRRAAGGRLRLDGPGFAAEVVGRRADLAGALEALPWAAADLVTGSALLDLVGAGWLARLVRAAATARVALLFALSVDGRHGWRPGDPADAAVAARFAAHQRRDKGFGPALGPQAADALRQSLRAAGFRVHAARSDWRLDGRTAGAALALQRELIDGMAAAAEAQDGTAAALVQAWRGRRQAAAPLTELRVGHLDLLALPPG